MIRVIGVDPGLASTGYGIITLDGRGKLGHVAHGVIETKSDMARGERLEIIYRLLCEVLDTYQPNQGAMEELFFAKNATSAIPVAEARGVCQLALRHKGIEACGYSPLAIKQAIVGNGRAQKNQVAAVVRILLGLQTDPKPDHAADALGAAICHAHGGLSGVPRA